MRYGICISCFIPQVNKELTPKFVFHSFLLPSERGIHTENQGMRQLTIRSAYHLPSFALFFQNNSPLRVFHIGYVGFFGCSLLNFTEDWLALKNGSQVLRASQKGYLFFGVCLQPTLNVLFFVLECLCSSESHIMYSLYVK